MPSKEGFEDPKLVSTKTYYKNTIAVVNGFCRSISSKTKGPGEKGAPRNHPETSSQKLADIGCRSPYDCYGRDRAPLWSFLGEGFWGNIQRPLVLPAPLVYC